MSTNETANWFTQGGQDYARYRPAYPEALLDFLLSTLSEPRHAVDIGCGTGQLTQLLAKGFDKVTGIDPSETQIASATPNERIDWRVGPAEQLPADLQGVNLITAAQAAHWFDLPAFYAEAKRIAAPDATIALISYGVLQTDETLSRRFLQFYYDEMGQYWPPERRLVDEGYAYIPFPFTEIPAPRLTITLQWDLAALMGYLSTWSAVKRANDAGHAHLLTAFYDDIHALWGDPATPRTFLWPVTIRAGK